VDLAAAGPAHFLVLFQEALALLGKEIMAVLVAQAAPTLVVLAGVVLAGLEQMAQP
jgi:hypothetical protein